MIDIHCHLLPGIDDGPETLSQALSLCRLMVANGINQAIVTPHIHLGRWNNTRETIASAYVNLSDALLQEGIDLTLGMAAEVRIDVEILPLLAMGEIPMLGKWQHHGEDYEVLLLELPHNRIPLGTDKLVQWLLQRNILPMIAHPERNKDFQRSTQKLQPFIDAGCLFQLTAASVVGAFGESAKTLSTWILENDLATVIATDAHNEAGRRPMLAEAKSHLCEHFDDAYAKRLTRTNPLALVAHKFSAGLDSK